MVVMDLNTLLEDMGQRLLERRKQQQWTQEELAVKANVTSQMISTAELGKKALRPENIIKLCAVLDISTDYLLTGKIAECDVSILSQKVANLSTAQYQHLENIIDNYIAALNL